MGHFKRSCKKYKQDLQDGKVEEKGSATAATGYGVVVICDGEQCLHTTESEIESVVDIGASFHVTPRRILFTTYIAGDHGTVKMGNSSSSVIHVIGDVCDDAENIRSPTRRWYLHTNEKSAVGQG